MKKKLFAILLTVCALVLALVGCGGKETIGLETTSYTYAGADIVLRVSNLDKAKEISLKEGETALKDADYSVEGSALTLKDAYLSALAEGDHGYALETDIGSVNFTVKVPQKSTPPDQGDGGKDDPPVDEPELSLTKTAYTYDDEEIVLTITDLDKAKTVSVKEGTAALASENYTVAGNKLTLKDGYLSSLTAGEHNYTVETDIGTVTFKVTVPDRTPSVTPASQTVELAELTADVEVTVTYNGRLLQSLKLNDENVDAANYETNASKLVLKKSYIETLGVGEHTFTLTTAGGSCTFTLTLVRNKLAVTATRIVASEGEVSFTLYGTANKTLGVSFGGMELVKDTHYTLTDDTFALKPEFVELLTANIYPIEITADTEKVNVYVAYETTWDQALYVDFDGAAAVADMPYAKIVTEEVAEGINGRSMRFTSSGVVDGGVGGVILHSGLDSTSKYHLTLKVKVESVNTDENAGFNGTMFMVFKAGPNLNIAYLYYSNNACNIVADNDAGRASAVSCVPIGDYYLVSVDFQLKEGENHLEVENWVSSTYILDDVKLFKCTDSLPNLTVDGKDFLVAKGSATDKTVNFGASVLGVKIGEEWATAEQVTVANDAVTFKAEWLNSLTKGTTTTYTVVTVYGEVSGTVEVPELTLETTEYAFDGSADVTLTVNNLGKATSVTLKNGETALTVDNDYMVEGNTLTLTASYLSSLQTVEAAEDVTFTLETEYGTVTFTVSVPKLEAGTPSVTDNEKEVELAEVAEPVTFEIDLNHGTFQKLSLKGADVAAENYETSVQGGTLTLSLKADYLKTLGAGTHEFTVTTTGGTCTFTLILTRNKLAVDETRIAASEGSVSFTLYGTAGKDVQVALGGMELTKDTHYTLVDDTFALKSEFAALLTADIYPVEITAGTEKVNVYVAYNTTWDQAIYVDYDEFTDPGNAIVRSTLNIFGTFTEVEEGIEGKSGQFARNEGVGVLMSIEADRIPQGQLYRLSIDFKVTQWSGSNDAISIKWGAGAGSIVSIYYIDETMQATKGDCAQAVACIPLANGVWRVITTFTRPGANSLDIETGSPLTVLFDNLKVFTVGAEDGKQPLVPEEKDFSVLKDNATAKTLDFGTAILSVEIGGTKATEEQVTIEGTQVTFLETWLGTLQSETTYTVYTIAGKIEGTITLTSVSLTGGSYKYNNDGQDMTFTLERGGQSVSKVELGDHEATSDEYTVDGDTLTLKPALLNRILGSAELKVTFDGGSVVTQELTSKRLLFVDFDEFGKVDGFPYARMDYEVVESGINGKSGKFTSTYEGENPISGFLAFGSDYVSTAMQAGTQYRLTMKLRIESFTQEKYNIFANLWIVIKGCGKGDMSFVYYGRDGEGVATATKEAGVDAVSCEKRDDYFELSLTFTPAQLSDTLFLDTWTVCSMLVDDILLAEV